MNKQAEMISRMDIIPTKCDCCGKMVAGFSDRSEWFGKYLKLGEDKICHDCIKVRDGYAEEFLEKLGISVEEYDKSRRNPFGFADETGDGRR